jgi:hypothetical protein
MNPVAKSGIGSRMTKLILNKRKALWKMREYYKYVEAIKKFKYH